jgi:hypothetical protein
VPPANDNFARAVALSGTAKGQGSFVADLTFASIEAKERRFDVETLRSVWYTITPTVTGYLWLQTPVADSGRTLAQITVFENR